MLGKRVAFASGSIQIPDFLGVGLILGLLGRLVVIPWVLWICK
jgi:di/tricarboxylate transporter